MPIVIIGKKMYEFPYTKMGMYLARNFAKKQRAKGKYVRIVRSKR